MESSKSPEDHLRDAQKCVTELTGARVDEQ